MKSNKNWKHDKERISLGNFLTADFAGVGSGTGSTYAGR